MEKKQMHYDEADKAIIKNSNIVQGFVGNPQMNFDSAEDAGVFFAQELDIVKSKTYDKVYPEMTALATFPITHELPEGAETFTYYSYEKTGMANIINNYSTDLPRADVKGKPTHGDIKSIGNSYGYSVQDMRASRMVGKNLDARRADAARYAHDNKVNKIAWAGDKENGLVGILTEDNNIPVYVLSDVEGKTEFSAKDCDQILADFSGAIEYMASTTKNVEKPDTVWMAPSRLRKLAMTRIEGTDSTVLKFLKDNLTDIKNWYESPELEANSTDTNPYAAENQAVMVLGKNDPDKFSLENPMEFYQYPVQEKGLEMVIPCESRTAGLIIYYPLSLLIVPGI